MGKTKVLLIDDDTLFGDLVTSSLCNKGYEVFYQNSLLGVADIVKRWKPDVVLLDVKIGNDDGISVIPEIRLFSTEIPIIVLSSYADTDNIYRALEKGVINYLTKPVNLEILPAFIERYVCAGKPLVVSMGTLDLNLDTRELYIDSTFVGRLTPKEFALLKLLMQHKNNVVTIEQIKEIWDNISMKDEHTIYNYVRRIRSILPADISLKKVTDGYTLI